MIAGVFDVLAVSAEGSDAWMICRYVTLHASTDTFTTRNGTENGDLERKGKRSGLITIDNRMIKPSRRKLMGGGPRPYDVCAPLPSPLSPAILPHPRIDAIYDVLRS